MGQRGGVSKPCARENVSVTFQGTKSLVATLQHGSVYWRPWAGAQRVGAPRCCDAFEVRICLKFVDSVSVARDSAGTRLVESAGLAHQSPPYMTACRPTRILLPTPLAPPPPPRPPRPDPDGPGLEIGDFFACERQACVLDHQSFRPRVDSRPRNSTEGKAVSN